MYHSYMTQQSTCLLPQVLAEQILFIDGVGLVIFECNDSNFVAFRLPETGPERLN